MTGAVQDRFEILPAGGALAPVLTRLHGLSFERPWGQEALMRLLALPGAFALMACAAQTAQEPAGFILARVAGREGEILTLGVAPAWRRSGAASALIQRVMEKMSAAGARALFLEVGLSNLAAQALYAHLGFETAGRRPGYYKQTDGGRETALLLRADIVPAPADCYDG